MKARGRYLLGIDFDGPNPPRVFAVPMRNATPLWNQAEAVDRDAFETMIDDARRKAREKDDSTK